MKIFICTGIYPPDIGGPATYSKILKDELPQYGVNVEILSFGEVRHLPKIIRHFVYFLKCLRRGGRADLIFAQDSVSVGLPSVLAAKILRKKFVLKIVGDYAWEQFQQKNKKSKCKNQNDNVKFKSLDDFQEERFDMITELRRKIQKFVANRADRIITPSEYLKRVVSEGWEIEERKIVVIENSFNLDISKLSTRIEARKNNNFVDSDFVVVSVGRSVPWKGGGMLAIVVADLIKSNNIPIKLRILGVNEKGVFKLIKLLGDMAIIEKKSLPEDPETTVEILRTEEDKDFALGTQPKEKVYEFLRASDLFVLNTGYEGLSHVILEAMACGAPVITTNIGGNPELIENGYNGILVEYNNKERIKTAILELWQSPELRQKFIDNSYKVLDKFSLANMIRQTIEVLKNVKV